MCVLVQCDFFVHCLRYTEYSSIINKMKFLLSHYTYLCSSLPLLQYENPES